MRYRLLHIIPLLAALLLAACTAETEQPATARGTFDFGLATDGLSAEIVTREAHQLTDDEAAGFYVTLTQDEEVVWSHKAYSTITQADRTQPLGEGYIVMAEDITAEEAESNNSGFGARRYAGYSEPFAIKSNETKHVIVPCAMANAGLCVVFDQSFTDYFTEYAVTTDDHRALKFNAANATTAIAYYNTDAATGTHTLPVIISASAGWDGTARLTRTLTLQTGKITRLNVKLNAEDPTGTMGISITIDTEFSNTDEDIVIDENI